MNRVIRESDVTVIELGPSYDSLDDEALSEFGGTVLDEAAHAEPPWVLLDLSGTSYIGSSFIELLVRAWKRLQQRGGALALCGVQPFCREVLNITRLDSLWPIYANRGDAIAAIKGP